jgi:hypothetical protein
MSRRLSPIANVAGLIERPKLPISPHVGEMSGRTEGGAVPPTSGFSLFEMARNTKPASAAG